MSQSFSTLTGADREFLEQWLGAHPIMPQVIDIARKLCAEGSDAAGDLDGLLAVAQAEAGTLDPPDDDAPPDDDDRLPLEIRAPDLLDALRAMS